MVKFLKKFLSNQKGQALPMVLCVLAIGGLTIAMSLNYSTTALNGSRIVRQSLNGIYAAGAGVEHVLWALKYGQPLSTNLTENINGMTVNMAPVHMGLYTLVQGELLWIDRENVHPEYVDVNTQMVPEGERYKYTITVTWQPAATGGINLIEIGARIPTGYVYDDSATIASENASGPDNINFVKSTFHQSTDNLSVWWHWFPPGQAPTIHHNNKILWLSFYLTGTGSPEGDYAWVWAARSDVGLVGEITGERYQITATATRPEDGRTTGRIVADVIRETGGTVYISSWQVNN